MAITHTVTCAHCGVTFQRVPSRMRAKQWHFCSRRCFALHQSAMIRDHPELLEHEARVRDCVRCGKSFAFKAKRFQSAKYCSRACMLLAGIIPDYIGAANPNYRHGQNQAAARGTALRWLPKRCAVCGWDTHVDIHHITPKTEGGKNDLENLVVLCPNHHRMADDDMLTREELTTLTAAASLRKG